MENGSNQQANLATQIKARYTCDICGKLIATDEGRLEIRNSNPGLGRVGAYPQASQDQWENLRPREQMQALGVSRDPTRGEEMEDVYSARELSELVMAGMNRPKNTTIQVHHYACDPDPDNSAYSIETSRITTLAQLVNWLQHLRQKDWFGKYESLTLLNTWYLAAGGRIDTSAL
jgi:hypothetical protein